MKYTRKIILFIFAWSCLGCFKNTPCVESSSFYHEQVKRVWTLTDMQKIQRLSKEGKKDSVSYIKHYY